MALRPSSRRLRVSVIVLGVLTLALLAVPAWALIAQPLRIDWTVISREAKFQETPTGKAPLEPGIVVEGRRGFEKWSFSRERIWRLSPMVESAIYGFNWVALPDPSAPNQRFQLNVSGSMQVRYAPSRTVPESTVQRLWTIAETVPFNTTHTNVLWSGVALNGLMLLCAIGAIVVGIMFVRRGFRLRAIRHGACICPRCDYELDASRPLANCSECGKKLYWNEDRSRRPVSLRRRHRSMLRAAIGLLIVLSLFAVALYMRPKVAPIGVLNNAVFILNSPESGSVRIFRKGEVAPADAEEGMEWVTYTVKPSAWIAPMWIEATSNAETNGQIRVRMGQPNLQRGGWFNSNPPAGPGPSYSNVFEDRMQRAASRLTLGAPPFRPRSGILWIGVAHNAVILVLACGLTFFLFRFFSLSVGLTRWQGADQHSCPRCGFSLDGHEDSEPCPECGQTLKWSRAEL